MENNQKDFSLAILYFLLSTLITAVFIGEKDSLYESGRQMLLSAWIAGAKWGIQLLAAFFFMGRKKYEFMRRMGFVCMIGSVMLVAVFLLSRFSIPIYLQFIIPLIASVIIMLILYYRAVKQTGLGLRWFFGWVACLVAAIFLQLTIVFHII